MFTLDISDFGIASRGTWYPLITFRIFNFLQQLFRPHELLALHWREKGVEAFFCLYSQHACQSTRASVGCLYPASFVSISWELFISQKYWNAMERKS
ncbi:MAG TPA: hypothetical protein V6C65_20500, partial [Allocoleopsis sp.]